jgi:hypothetical protein
VRYEAFVVSGVNLLSLRHQRPYALPPRPSSREPMFPRDGPRDGIAVHGAPPPQDGLTRFSGVKGDGLKLVVRTLVEKGYYAGAERPAQPLQPGGTQD